MRKMKSRIAALIFAIASAVTAAAAGSVPFVDTSKSPDFFDINIHALVGGSYVTNNYTDIFPQISDINSSMRMAWGAGAGATFNVNRFFGFGTELNLTFNSTRTTFNVASEDSRHLSDVYLRNNFRYINIPFFVTFRFHLAPQVKWNVDGGLYYSYGVGGKQKSTIYTATVNDLGQLILNGSTVKSDYFNDPGCFLNSYLRGDIGLHLATGLTFHNRVNIGIRLQTGLKNVARSYGVANPSSHNFNFFASVGYIF